LGRILGLDVGEKTIGVALTDEAQTLAFPGTTIWRQEGKKRDMAALRQIIAENAVCAIVVGIPLLDDGSEGIQAGKVREFVANLRNSVRIPIYFQDERLTTFEAEQHQIAQGIKPEDRKKTVDSVAASLILQAYLNERNR
jgi:putative holliday junction resolvase